MEKYYVGIDIGSSKVKMVIGKKNEEGLMAVVSSATVKYEGMGMNSGTIVNYMIVGRAIKQAKEIIKEDCGLHINSAYVGMGGRSIRSVIYTDSIEVRDAQCGVVEYDVQILDDRIKKVQPHVSEDVIERILQHYNVDKGPNTNTPVGMMGTTLSATYLFVMFEKTQKKMLDMALKIAEIKQQGFVLNPIAVANMLVGQEERQEGAAMIDIGDGTTDVAVMRNDVLRYVASIPIGGSAINEDLRSIGTIASDTDKVKCQACAAIAENVAEDDFIKVGRNKQYNKHNVAVVTEARLMDIIEFIRHELDAASSLKSIPYGFIMAGGVAMTNDIDTLINRETQQHVRVGDTFEGLDMEATVCSPYSDAAAFAVMIYGGKREACDVRRTDEPIVVETTAQQVATPAVQETPLRSNRTVEDETTVVTDNSTTEEVEQQDEEIVEKPKKRSWWKRFTGTMTTLAGGGSDNNNDDGDDSYL